VFIRTWDLRGNVSENEIISTEQRDESIASSKVDADLPFLYTYLYV